MNISDERRNENLAGSYDRLEMEIRRQILEHHNKSTNSLCKTEE